MESTLTTLSQYLEIAASNCVNNEEKNSSAQKPGVTTTHEADPTKPGFVCKCGLTLGSKSSLTLHLKYLTSNKMFPCDLCKRRFLWAAHLRYHKRIDHKVKASKSKRNAFGCTTCGKYFRSCGQLSKHRVQAHKLKPAEDKRNLPLVVAVRIAGRKTKSVENRVSVAPPKKAERTGESGSKITKRPDDSESTEITHEVDVSKPGLACMCGARFVVRRDLRLHLLDNAPPSERKFECDLCGIRFSRGAAWRCHLRVKHKKSVDKSNAFGCSSCGQPFASFTELMCHRRDVHKNKKQNTDKVIAEAKITEVGLSPPPSYLSNSACSPTRQEFACGICQQRFQLCIQLSRHLKVNHEVLSLEPRCCTCDLEFLTIPDLSDHNLMRHKTSTVFVGSERRVS